MDDAYTERILVRPRFVLEITTITFLVSDSVLCQPILDQRFMAKRCLYLKTTVKTSSEESTAIRNYPASIADNSPRNGQPDWALR